MAATIRRIGFTVLAACFAWSAAGVLPAKEPAKGPAEALQQFAEKQGHGARTAKALRGAGYEVPPEIEEAVAASRAKGAKRPLPRVGSLVSRLETVLGRPLTVEEKDRIQKASDDFARRLEEPRKKFIAEVARSTRIPDDWIQGIMPSLENQDPSADKKFISRLEGLTPSRLNARQLGEIRTADEDRRASAATLQEAHARQIAKITGLRASIISELLWPPAP
jgi:hypothetical protein